MRTKNQTEQPMLELVATKAANDDEVPAADVLDEATTVHKQAWSPLEVWRTRVKSASPASCSESAPI